MTRPSATVCSTPDRCSERHSYGPGCLLDTAREPSPEDLQAALDGLLDGRCRVVPLGWQVACGTVLPCPDHPSTKGSEVSDG